MASMDDQTTTSAERRWSRRTTDRLIAGVAGGIADATGAPVWLVRTAFVIAAVLGSAGAWLYLLLWWAMPRRDLPESAAQRLARRFPHAPVWLGVVLLGLGSVWFAAQLGWLDPPLLIAMGLIGVGILLFARDTEQVAATSIPTGAIATAPLPPSPPETALPPASLPPRPPRQRRRPSFLGPLTLGVGLLLVAIGALLDLAGWVSFDLAEASALLLLVLGIGMAVGTVIGRARWLILPILAIVPVALATAVLHIDLDDGVGERTVTVTAAGDVVERLAVGEMTIDLTRLPRGASADVEASLGIGLLTLNVPDDATVVLEGEVGFGTTEALYGRIVGPRDTFACCVAREPVGGYTVPLRWDPRHDPVPDGGTITIDAAVSVGAVRINHVYRGADR
jgi:phage shock protein PspC (stress-responsive transcriptional regulator)